MACVDGPSKKCSNCRQDISAGSYEVHVTRCWRYTTYCEICEEPVASDDWESHQEECHTPKPCPLCHQSVVPGEAEQHLEECLEGMVLCKYCDLEFKRRGYSEHVEACGSRTEPCEQCSLRVRLKDMQEHLDMKCGHMKSEAPLDPHTLAHLYPYPPPHHHDMDSPTHIDMNDDLLDEQWVESVGGACTDNLDSVLAQNMFYFQAARPEPHPPLAPSTPPDTDGDMELARRLQDEEIRRDRVFEMDQNLARQFQQDEPPQPHHPHISSDLPTSSNYHHPHTPTPPPTSSYYHHPHTPTPPPTDVELAQILQNEEVRRDEQFGRDLELARQLQHENRSSHPHTPHTSTALSGGVGEGGDEALARRLQMEEDKFQHMATGHTSQSQAPPTHTVDDPLDPVTLLLPCQFCDQTFPAHQLTLHQNSCRGGRGSVGVKGVCGAVGGGGAVDKDSVTARKGNLRQCEYCGLAVSESEASVHQVLCEKNPDVGLSTAYPSTHPPSPPRTLSPSHTEKIEIPCETCNELYPLNDLYKHQVACRLKTTGRGRETQASSFQGSSLAPRPSSHTTNPATGLSSHTTSVDARSGVRQSRGKNPKVNGRPKPRLAIRFPDQGSASLSVRGKAIKKPNSHMYGVGDK